MDVSGLISSFRTGTYTVTRRVASTVTRGRAVDGTSSTVTITASVYPSSGAEISRLPEGRRVKEARTIITSTVLYLGGVGSAYEADRISIDSQTWELAHIELWRDPVSGNAAYKCIAVDTA